MNDLIRAALIWIGMKIAAFVGLIEGLGWAALNGVFTGGSDTWDDLANYGSTDHSHLIKVMAASMAVSMGQYLRSQSQLREQRLEYELKLVTVRSHGLKTPHRKKRP